MRRSTKERITLSCQWLLILSVVSYSISSSSSSSSRHSFALAFSNVAFVTRRQQRSHCDRREFTNPTLSPVNPSLVPRSPIPPASSSTARFMVFDFFKQRTQEGIQQLNNLASASYQGQLSKGLQNVLEYTQQTNAKFYDGLSSSRTQLLSNLDRLFGSMGLALNLSGINQMDEWLENLLNVLLQADLGMSTSEDIIQEVKSFLVSQEESEGDGKSSTSSSTTLTQDDLLSILRGKLVEALETGQSRRITFSEDSQKLPTVLFIMGANGMGKTTTIGKLAHRLRTEGNQKVLLAACDTFRAGAVAQLAQWAERAQVDICTPAQDATSLDGAVLASATSPSAVLYAALDKAIAEHYDTVLVDTSGRLSNNDALTAELAKMKRVIQKRLSVEKDEATGKPINNIHVPHETLLVMDAAQGRMALDAAKVWHEEIGLTGLILTKLDGSARGGSVVAISRELKLPVKLIGVGEGMDDLRDFEPESFVDGLLGVGDAGGSAASSKDGSVLASRLAEMRKDRDARAAAQQVMKKSNEPAMAMSSGTAMSAAGAAETSTKTSRTPASNKPSNRSKKSKKGKR